MNNSIIQSVLCGFLMVIPGTYISAQTHIESINTAIHHITAVQVPEPVENVAVGSEQIHVE